MDEIKEPTSEKENASLSTNEENRIPLSETPHYKMLGYLMRMSKRFFHFQREYYNNGKSDLDLAQMTTQFFGQSMQVRKKRLDSLGLTMDLELKDATDDLKYGSEYYNMESKEDTQNEYGIRNRLMYVHRRFYKKKKCIYKQKSTEMSVISILKSKVKDGVASCPNCGYSATVSSFIEGCAACGTKFTVHDFEPKISGFSLQKNMQTKLKDVFDSSLRIFMIPGFCIAGILIILYCLLSLIDLFFELPIWLFSFWDFLGIIWAAGYYALLFSIPTLFLLSCILPKAKQRLYNHPITGQEHGTKLFSNFSVPDFYQNVEAKLCNIHLIDDAKKASAFTKCSLTQFIPAYKDVVDCDLINLHFIDGNKAKEGYYLECDAMLHLFCYSGRHIHTEYEQIKLLMYGKKNVVDQPITAMRMYPCPTCGNSLNVLEGTECMYCGNTYDFTNFDWVIETYEGKRRKDYSTLLIWGYILVAFLVSFLLHFIKYFSL
ncbi:MAG: hypothetical protein K2K56_04610 [Lachnospiraceae bacterium]|nr:hypothetical protein [Lachnospiraceae bacterium]